MKLGRLEYTLTVNLVCPTNSKTKETYRYFNTKTHNGRKER